MPSPPATPATPGLRAPSAATRSPGFLACALAIARKDLQIELRTREIVTTGGFFAVLVTVMASIAFSAGPKTQVRIAPGAIWLPIAFASVLALGRTWQREREESALTGLLVAPVPRASIFAGKALGVLALMLAVEALVVPTVALLFHIDVVPYLPKLLPLLLLGTLGIAATGTLFGAMTVRTSARDLVLASVLFPLLSPVLLSAVAGTALVFGGGSFDELRDYLVLLAVFDAVAVAGGVAVFGSLVDD
ncbi:MAG TPA: heme exporter protein CcmB [Polyangiaceae bacterium]|nr:heme exporter protein CcmB [Polyangiaceae bacterium]